MPPSGQQLTVAIQAKDLLGLLPGIDRKQTDKPFVVDGKNFLFNAKGPYSGWGRQLATKASYHDLVISHNTSIQSFRTNDNTAFIFTNEGIFGYDSASMTFYAVYPFAAIPDDTYEWTECFIANKHYFCHKGVGVIEYTPLTKAWKLFTNAELVADPIAVANARGRLVILGSIAYQWSALDDPNDLVFSLTTGAGLQLTAILGGTSQKVLSLGDSFLVFTTAGIIIGEFSGSQAVFRHRVLTRQYHAINASCIQELDTGKILFIDEKGLFTTDGTEPKVFNPLFSEFLSSDLLRVLRSPGFANYKLFIYQPRQLIFVKISSIGIDEHFEKAYALYRPTDKFGSFDSSFHNFIELPVDNGVEIIYQFCVVEENGAIKVFTEGNYNEQTELPSNGFFYQVDFDLPVRIINGVYVFSSLMTVSAELLWLFSGVQSGWYTVGDQVRALDTLQTVPAEEAAYISGIAMDGGFTIIGPINVPRVLGPLDAELQLGLFRYAELLYDDELGSALHLTLWSGETVSEEDEDYALETGTEDWNTLIAATEDWGFGITQGDSYGVRMVGTLDSYNEFLSQDLINIVSPAGRINRYPCDVTGQFFLVKIIADEYPQMFRISGLEIAGSRAGRLS